MGKWDNGEFSRVLTEKMKRLYYASANKGSVEFDETVERNFKVFIQGLEVDNKKVQACFSSLISTHFQTHNRSRNSAPRYGGYPSHIPRAHRHYDISTSRSGLRREERARTVAARSRGSEVQQQPITVASSDDDPVANARSSLYVHPFPSGVDGAAEQVYHPYRDLALEHWQSVLEREAIQRYTAERVEVQRQTAGTDRASGGLNDFLWDYHRPLDPTLSRNNTLHPHSDYDQDGAVDNNIDRPRSSALPDDWPALPDSPDLDNVPVPSIVNGRSYRSLGQHDRSPFPALSARARRMLNLPERMSEHNDVPPPISPADIDQLLAGITTGVQDAERPHAVPGRPTDSSPGNDDRSPSPVRRVISRQSDMDRARLEAQPPIRRRLRSGAVDQGSIPNDGQTGLARHVRPRTGIDNITPQNRDPGQRRRVRQSAPPQVVSPIIDIHTILQDQTVNRHDEVEPVATDPEMRDDRPRVIEPPYGFPYNFQYEGSNVAIDWETMY